MTNQSAKFPHAVNEPVLPYAPGDKARKEIEAQIKTFRAETADLPLIIGGKEIRTGNTAKAIEPHNHKKVLANVHQAGEKEVGLAIEAAAKAKKTWENFTWEERSKVFLKAADLLAGKYRAIINASTMLNQSKTVHQAEIDSACEMIDFFRFNVDFLQKIYADQPINSPGVSNRMEYRALEGFVFAVSPFNFTSIAGNLSGSPALMGNTVIWKPSGTALFSNYFIMKVWEEAGLPPGVVNFLPGASSAIAPRLLSHRDLAGVHFTGSTSVFHNIWKTVGNNIDQYKSYPRLVGETGGKDFIFVHPDIDAQEVATALVRGAFEYQGQKCSAASRAYIPRSVWPKIEKEMLAQLSEVKMGDPSDFTNFVSAVIDEKSFDKLTAYIERARKSTDCKIIAGGKTDKTVGYFVEPTVILTTNPKYETMCEELFGPVLTIYIYEDKDIEATFDLCDTSTDYALTGAFFSRDRKAVEHATKRLQNAAGNFYINDKPTGAVVGQQPFGGGRASGTNDKAGSMLNLIRWTSPRTIKETFEPAKHFRYPFLG